MGMSKLEKLYICTL